jgi:type IV secretory pathway VirB2 component (pilin)
MKKVLAVSLFVSFLALPLIVNAAGVDPVGTVCNLLQVIKTIIAAIGFGIAIIVLIVGGIGYMTAGGNEEKATKSKKLMINAIIGIAIVFAAVFILALVQGLLAGADINVIGDPCGNI